MKVLIRTTLVSFSASLLLAGVCRAESDATGSASSASGAGEKQTSSEPIGTQTQSAKSPASGSAGTVVMQKPPAAGSNSPPPDLASIEQAIRSSNILASYASFSLRAV